MESSDEDQKPSDESYEDLLRKLQQLQQQNMALKKSLCLKQKSIQNIKDLGNQKRNEVRLLERKHEMEMNRFENDIKNQEAQQERLTREIDEIKAQREQKKGNKEEVSIDEESEAENGRIQQLELELDKVNVEMTQRLVDEYKSEINRLKEEINQLTLMSKKLKETNQERKKEFEGSLKKTNDLREEVKTKHERKRKLKGDIQNTLTRLNGSNQGIFPHFQNLLEKRIQVERKNAQIERDFAIARLETKIELNEKQNAIDAVRQEIAVLQSKPPIDVKKNNKKKTVGCFRRVLFRHRA
ncbi:chromosome partition protein Smc-like [Montipora capricornis]|uniref:chromosome partition protein Smc-like n=1 Tax=Montipora capricornis TaxID=246305 RepID=UPI0035F1DB15